MHCLGSPLVPHHKTQSTLPHKIHPYESVGKWDRVQGVNCACALGTSTYEIPPPGVPPVGGPHVLLTTRPPSLCQFTPSHPSSGGSLSGTENMWQALLIPF